MPEGRYRSSNGALVSFEQVTVLAQPSARLLVAGTRMSDEAPEVAGMIEASQMHQLVNQHVVANRVGHQDETPVEGDVACRRAGPPARALIPYTDARHRQAVMVRQATQAIGKLLRCPSAELPDGFGRVGGPVLGTRSQLGPLAFNPVVVLFGKELGVAAGSPSRNGDTDTSVGAHADYIASGSGMADEIHERITIVLRHGS